MRSAGDLRRRWLDLVPRMVTAPGMWATDGHAFDVMAWSLLADLCFLDEREADLEAMHAALDGFGQLGVAGPFIALFGKEHSCVAEVASVFAEQFHRLGYLQVDRVVDAPRWDQLIGVLRDRFDGLDVRRSEVVAEFGEPSLIVGHRVLCYAPSERQGWVFIDCFTERRQKYVPGAGRYEDESDTDPLVRAVRCPGEDFESGLILTLYGKVQRWGPGWWIDQPERLSPEQEAIAAQLRSIERADPSQNLRPRPGRRPL